MDYPKDDIIERLRNYVNSRRTIITNPVTNTVYVLLLEAADRIDTLQQLLERSKDNG